MYPYANPSILTKSLSALKTIKWGTILDGTQKTLGVINQAIPIVYQVKPIITNAKTLFKIANVIKEPDKKEEQIIKKESNTSPIFYI